MRILGCATVITISRLYRLAPFFPGYESAVLLKIFRTLRRFTEAVTFFLSSGKQEVHRDLRLDFNGFVIQDVGPIAPLADRVDRSLHEHGVSTDNLQILDRTDLLMIALRTTGP